MARTSDAERQKKSREKKKAVFERALKADNLLLQLYGAAYTASYSGRIPREIVVSQSSEATALNLIDWLKGQSKLLEVETTKPASKGKRA